MRAVDTNIVVRYLTGDDPGQAAKAKAVIDAGYVLGIIYLTKTHQGTTIHHYGETKGTWQGISSGNQPD